MKNAFLALDRLLRSAAQTSRCDTVLTSHVAALSNLSDELTARFGEDAADMFEQFLIEDLLDAQNYVTQAATER